jgi:hypothetical protein
VSAEENTSLVQSAYEVFGRGDMDAFAEVMADDIEWMDPGDPDDDPNAGNVQRQGSSPRLVWWSCVDYRLHDVRAARSSSPRTTRWYPWCTPRRLFRTPAARS